MSFTTFKHNLLSVCDKAERVYNSAHEDFFENFTISIMIHCMRHEMKEINEEVSQLKKKDDDFRLLYSPSISSIYVGTSITIFRVFSGLLQVSFRPSLHSKN